MKPEARIEAHFVRYCHYPARGVYALKLRIDGANGFPDRTVLTPAGVFFVEFKAPAGKLSPTQIAWKAKLEKLGFAVLVPKAIGEAEKFLDDFLRKGNLNVDCRG